jgi:YidC/Oxa1 family membrane protein insertase
VSELWTVFFFQPMLNGLLFLYDLLGQNFALSIAIFTVLVRLITLPLTLPQQKSAKKMQKLQPQLQQLQKKYAKDKEKLSQEQMKLYKEHGVNPMGGCLPMLIQFPIWIGLYQSISRTLSSSPLPLLDLSKNIYPFFPHLSRLFPLNDRFLGMNLGRADPPYNYVMAILVAGTMYLQQSMMAPSSDDSSAASMTQSMQYTMPLMFGFFSLQFPAGLSLYFVVSSVVGIVIQYVLNNWGELSLQKVVADLRIGKPVKANHATEVAVSEKPVGKGRKDGRRKKKRRS